MNSNSIRLIKQAAYYIKKAEFEKQSGIKGKNIAKAWEAGVKGVEAIGEGAKNIWKWLKSWRTKKTPEHNYDTVVPKDSLLDRTVQTSTNYNGNLGLEGELYHKDVISRRFTPEQRPERLFSEALRPTSLIDPLPDLYHETERPDLLGGPVQGLIGQRDISIGLRNLVHPDVRRQIARKYFQERVKTPEQRAEFHRLVSPDRSISPAAINSLEQRARWADMLQYLAQNSGNGKRQLFFKTLRLNPLSSKEIANLEMDGYSATAHDIDIRRPYFPMTLGHELGHALYYSRPSNPKYFTDYLTTRYQLPWLSRVDRPHHMDGFDTGYGEQFSNMLHEIGANHEFHKLMRGALKDNPQLYNRFKTQSYNFLMPALWTYFNGNATQFRNVTKKLPEILPPSVGRYVPSLQANANKYLDNAAQWGEKINNHIGSPTVIPWVRDEAYYRNLLHTNDAVWHNVEKQDPTLYSDIYNHMLQKGMPVPQNAWYNNFQPVDQPQRPIDLLMRYTPTMLK